jgi:predicted regulator of Ras-like GTPase activity (Roadblock/LC7/MglB family)
VLSEQDLTIWHDYKSKPQPPSNVRPRAHLNDVPVLPAQGTCDTVTRMDAEAALSELLEISPYIVAALVAERDGETLAASIAGRRAVDDAATQLGTQIAGLIARAERAQSELGREPISQLEVAVGDGNVFVVLDSAHMVAAVTGSEPTVGLVFYELKTTLRALRAGTNGNAVGGASTTTPNEGSTV